MAEDSTRPIECAPVFVVRDVAASLAYYRDALGFVGSADDVHRELVARGARVVKPPATYPYGMRDFDVEDLDGNSLVFGHAVRTSD
jgi:uncharacterized glyoxalase superfamily protein PhnB